MASGPGSAFAPLAWRLPGSGVRASIAASRKIVLASSGVTPNRSYVSFAPLSAASSKYMEVTVTRVGVAPYSPLALSSPPTFAVGIGLGFGAPGTLHNAERMPGWDPALVGYHSDDGSLFMGKPTADRTLSGPWHAVGAVAGVGVFPPGAVVSASPASTWRLVFTLNGAVVMERELGAALDVTSLQFAIGIIGDNVEVDVNGGSTPFRFGPGNPGGVPEAPLPVPEVPVAAPAPVSSGPPTGSDAEVTARIALVRAEIDRLRASEAAALRETTFLRPAAFPTMTGSDLDAVVHQLRMLHSVASSERARRSGLLLVD